MELTLNTANKRRTVTVQGKGTGYPERLAGSNVRLDFLGVELIKVDGSAAQLRNSGQLRSSGQLGTWLKTAQIHERVTGMQHAVVAAHCADALACRLGSVRFTVGNAVKLEHRIAAQNQRIPHTFSSKFSGNCLRFQLRQQGCGFSRGESRTSLCSRLFVGGSERGVLIYGGDAHRERDAGVFQELAACRGCGCKNQTDRCGTHRFYFRALRVSLTLECRLKGVKKLGEWAEK